MRDIKEAPFGRYIWIYIDGIYGIMKYKGIIKCNDSNIDVFLYIVIASIYKDEESECVIDFKCISGWDYLEDEINQS